MNFIVEKESFHDIIDLIRLSCERCAMTVSYNKLWKLLIDKNMKKKELSEAAGISNSLIAKLGKNENVTVDVLVRICAALDCGMDDIMEFVPENEQAI